MRDFIRAAAENAQTLIAAAFERAMPELSAQGARLSGEVVMPRHTRYGELSANHALVSAAALGVSPAELAGRIAQSTEPNGSCFASVTAAGAGFLNFTLSDEWYNAVLDAASRLSAVPAAAAGAETALDVLRRFPHKGGGTERELALRGDMANPVYRVRYAYRRMGAVMDNCAASSRPVYPAETADAARLTRGDERALIRLLAALPRECARAAECRDTSPLCAYALELADEFYGIYAVPQYFSADEHTLAQRLHLLAAARCTLGYALDRAGVNKNGNWQ